MKLIKPFKIWLPMLFCGLLGGLVFFNASLCIAETDPNCPVPDSSSTVASPADSSAAVAGTAEPWQLGDVVDRAAPGAGFLFDVVPPKANPPPAPAPPQKPGEASVTYVDPKTGKEITVPIKDVKEIGGRTWVQKTDGTWVLLPPEVKPPKPKTKKDDDGTITTPEGKKLKPGDKGYDEADAELAKQKAAEEEAAQKKAAAEEEAARKKAEKEAADREAKTKADRERELLKIIRDRNSSAAEAEAALQEYEASTGKRARRN